jgi:hypothetical protein
MDPSSVRSRPHRFASWATAVASVFITSIWVAVEASSPPVSSACHGRCRAACRVAYRERASLFNAPPAPFELPQIMIRPKIKELPRQGFVRFVAGLRRFLVRDATN